VVRVAKCHPYAEELWFLMHHSDDPRKVTIALTCYCDDSGSHDQSNTVVIGAILMSKPRFIEFNLAWDKILKEFRLDGIHMKDFARIVMAPEMKKALFITIAKVINRYKEYSFTIGIPQADYRSLFSGDVCRDLMGPYAMAFFSAVILNRDASIQLKNSGRIAYLVDKGNRNHHEQMQAAHAILLQIEKARGERFTGAMASDIDDNNNALQAADVIAWTYHRKLESPDFGEEFLPLLSIFEDKTIGFPHRRSTRYHITFLCPKEAIKLFSSLINNWIVNHGEIPTWQELAAADPFLNKTM